jgi:hypothetical protein
MACQDLEDLGTCIDTRTWWEPSDSLGWQCLDTSCTLGKSDDPAMLDAASMLDVVLISDMQLQFVNLKSVKDSGYHR